MLDIFKVTTMTMALPSIAHRQSDHPHIKLDLQKLQDEFDPAPSVRSRARSSSRESARRKQLFNVGSGSIPSLNREKSSYSLSSRPFSRSRSGTDLRAMVTSRNALNNVRSAEKLNDDTTGRPPLPRAGSMAVLPSARIHPKPERTPSNNSLLANPRSSSGHNSYRTTPVMHRKMSKGVSNPDIRQKGLSNSPINVANDSPASTPGLQRRRIVDYIDRSPEDSRPSSGNQSSGHSNGRNAFDGHIYRDVRIVSNSATQRVTESNISRKEKVIHIVQGADSQSKENTANEDSKLTDNGATQMSNTTNTPLTSRENLKQSDGHTHGMCSEMEVGAEKLYVNRDNIEPPPTPRVGVGENGEGLSMEVFIKCVDWLDGVHQATQQKTLDVVTLPPIEWND